MIGIYKITNTENNKIYIGQSVDIRRRWQEHKRKYLNEHLNTNLYQDMRIYGLDKFQFDVIEECSKEELNNREEYYIQYYHSYDKDKGYNMSRIKNYQHKVDESTVIEIQQLLQNSNLTNVEIAKKFNVSHTWVSLVNQGKMWFNENLSYPLRPVGVRIKKIQYCIDCNKEITSRATRCAQCELLRHKKAFESKITREELKYLIRTLSFVEIGKRFNVSDNAIRKWCKRYDLPQTKKEIKKYSDEEWSKI